LEHRNPIYLDATLFEGTHTHTRAATNFNMSDL
jgi:hypothetical protein